MLRSHLVFVFLLSGQVEEAWEPEVIPKENSGTFLTSFVPFSMSLFLSFCRFLLLSSSICLCFTFCFIVSFSFLSPSLLYLSCRKDVLYSPAQYEFLYIVSQNGKTITSRNSYFCPEREIAMFHFHERGGTLKLLPTSLHPHSLSSAVRCHYNPVHKCT